MTYKTDKDQASTDDQTTGGPSDNGDQTQDRGQHLEPSTDPNWENTKEVIVDWATETITPEEKEMLANMHPLQAEYLGIMRMLYSLGARVLKPKKAHQQHGSNSKHWDNKRDKKEVLQDLMGLKAAAILRFTAKNGRGIDQDSFIFDAYASGYLNHGYRINSLSGSVELKGETVILDDLYTDSYIKYRAALGVKIPNKQAFIDQVLSHLADKKGNPWLDKMKSLVPLSPDVFLAKHKFDPHRMAEFITGDVDDLVQTLWLYQFIGSMDRTFNPGCKHDHMLILISAEKGLRKTTLLETIAKLPDSRVGANPYYIQLRTLKSQKENQERLKGKTIVNLDECDSAFRGLNSDDLKETVTASTDNYRTAYAIDAQDRPRTCTLFGTTNTVNLIQDLKGDRRFFPVQVARPIEIEWVVENWESFWGFYLWCYNEMQAGNAKYRHHLSKIEEAALTKIQSKFKAIDPWLETIIDLLDILEDANPAMAIKANDLLTAVNKETGAKKAHMQISVMDLLKTDRGYAFGKPILASGHRANNDLLHRGGTKEAKPVLITPQAIADAFVKLYQGSYTPQGNKALLEPEDTQPPMAIREPLMQPSIPDIESPSNDFNIDDAF